MAILVQYLPLFWYGRQRCQALKKPPVMKKHHAFLVLSAVLMAFGVLAIIGSFAVYFLRPMFPSPVLVVAQSLALFGAGTVALWGQQRSFEAANARRRTCECAQLLAQRATAQRW